MQGRLAENRRNAGMMYMIKKTERRSRSFYFYDINSFRNERKTIDTLSNSAITHTCHILNHRFFFLNTWGKVVMVT